MGPTLFSFIDLKHHGDHFFRKQYVEGRYLEVLEEAYHKKAVGGPWVKYSDLAAPWACKYTIL